MVMELSFDSASEEETFKFGEALGVVAEKGDCFALYGTLGMGKSVLSRGFIKKLSGEGEVPSPTFTLVQMYRAEKFEIYHYDLYRLKFPDEVFELSIEEALSQGVTLIEWPEKMGDYLPKDAFVVEITPEKGKRVIKISCRDEKKFKRLNVFFKKGNKDI